MGTQLSLPSTTDVHARSGCYVRGLSSLEITFARRWEETGVLGLRNGTDE